MRREPGWISTASHDARNVEQILGDEAQAGERPARGARNFDGGPGPKTPRVQPWRAD
jgi:hypothetical protein